MRSKKFLRKALIKTEREMRINSLDNTEIEEGKFMDVPQPTMQRRGTSVDVLDYDAMGNENKDTDSKGLPANASNSNMSKGEML